METKSIANTLYNGSVLGFLTVGYTILTKKNLISATIAGSLATQSWLVAQGIIPQNKVKSK